MTRIIGKSVVIDSFLVQAERAAHAAKSVAEELHEEARGNLLAAMGDAEYATTENGSTIKYTEVKTKRLDGKALTAAHPDIALQFQVDSAYRKLVVKA
jgi:predicted phage-related endonuclease